jgi:hypothetical protein
MVKVLFPVATRSELAMAINSERLIIPDSIKREVSKSLAGV